MYIVLAALTKTSTVKFHFKVFNWPLSLQLIPDLLLLLCFCGAGKGLVTGLAAQASQGPWCILSALLVKPAWYTVRWYTPLCDDCFMDMIDYIKNCCCSFKLIEIRTDQQSLLALWGDMSSVWSKWHWFLVCLTERHDCLGALATFHSWLWGDTVRTWWKKVWFSLSFLFLVFKRKDG